MAYMQEPTGGEKPCWGRLLESPLREEARGGGPPARAEPASRRRRRP